MPAHWTDGDRAVWDEMQRDAAPTVRTLVHETRKARKTHDCSICRKPGIRKGDDYLYNAAVVDGEFTVSRTCASSLIDPDYECSYRAVYEKLDKEAEVPCT